GLEKTFTQTEIERLLDRGVLHAEHDQGTGTFRIVQGLTTYLKDANVTYRKIAGMRIHDYLHTQSREAVQRYIGKVGDSRTVKMMTVSVVNRLTQLVRGPLNHNGVLTTGVDSNGNIEPAFKNVLVTFDGLDLITISFEAHPVGEVAYITISATLTPTQISAAA
ncbi:MAG: hypothetical protein KDE34_13360, partial [Anaerolineales bacterium]|nr:hypothetical protein [Anaerolineales bacterium]